MAGDRIDRPADPQRGVPGPASPAADGGSQQALHESEARFQAAFDQAAVGMAHMALDGRFLRVNQRLCDMLGYAATELLALRFLDITHPDDLAVGLDDRRRTLDGQQKSFSVEKRYLHRSGRPVWVELTCTLIRDQQGRPQNLLAVILNIDARKTLERERDRLFDTSRDLRFVADADGRVLRINPEFTRALGWTLADLDARSWRAIVHPDDQAAWSDAYRSARDGREQLDLDVRVADRAGGHRWLSCNLHPDPVRQELYGDLRDVTARRQRDEHLRLLEVSMAQLSDGVLITDAALQAEEGPLVVYANEAVERICGWPLQEILGRPVRLLQGPGIDRAEVERVRAALRERRRFRTEILNPGRDGRSCWIALDVAPVLGPGGEATHLACVLRDVTERRRVMDALRESEARHRELFDANPLPMWIYDPGTLAFLAVNDAAVRHYGYAREEFLTMTLADIRPADEVPALKTEIEFARRNEMQRRFWRHRRKDGRLIDVDVSGQPLAFEGRPARVVQATDVTEQMRATRELSDSRESLRALLQRLRRTEQAERERIARRVHDELGQLLTGLRMDLRWLERRLAPGALPAALDGVPERLAAASELNDQTLAAVKSLAAELRPPTPDPLGLGAALAQAARQFQARYGVACTVDAEPALPRLSRQATGELFGIFQEAMTNAARHAQARAVHVGLRRRGGGVELLIEDDGVGFDPGGADAAASLGLLGMRERALACGADFELSSTPGQGTCVRVHLSAPARAP